MIGRCRLRLGTELNGWPASPRTDATPTSLPPSAYGLRPELLAMSSLYDSFIHYSKPVYPGAFNDMFLISDFETSLAQIVLQHIVMSNCRPIGCYCSLSNCFCCITNLAIETIHIRRTNHPMFANIESLFEKYTI